MKSSTTIRIFYLLIKKIIVRIRDQFISALQWSRMEVDKGAMIGPGVILQGSGMVVVRHGCVLVGDLLIEVSSPLSIITIDSDVRIEGGVRITCRGSGEIRIGQNSLLSEGATLICESEARLELAEKVVIGKHVEIISASNIFLGDHSSVGAYTLIEPREQALVGGLKTGHNCHISDHNVLDTSGGIEFGNHVRTGHFDILHTHNHSIGRNELIWDQPVKFSSIRIGDGVWIGSSVNILPGVIVGDGGVIAAGAVVTKQVEAYNVVGGVPARVISTRAGETTENI